MHAITLMGMSGVGKTHLSRHLAEWGWVHYSCDVEIGRELLGEEIQAKNLSRLTEFLGLPGDPAKGGIALEEFKRRQSLYIAAEIIALDALGNVIPKAGGRHLVNDSTGSLCEITQEQVIKDLAARTHIVYIESSPQEVDELLRRAQVNPKPLYYPPAHLEAWIHDYCQESGAGNVQQMDTKGFARWAFPRLVQSRRPKYRRIADQYGRTVSSAAVRALKTEADFLRLIGA